MTCIFFCATRNSPQRFNPVKAKTLTRTVPGFIVESELGTDDTSSLSSLPTFPVFPVEKLECALHLRPRVSDKVRHRPDGKLLPQIALPIFGYKSYIDIDRRLGFIRLCAVTSAVDPEGRELRTLMSAENTLKEVWADTT